ncbi:hypothetical protein [Pseudonocardia sp. GCM10023141]|uniref:hypothetical protein n=1 Tax=Pseudonocardia sp. GCM10023141 TaxID=3252653 RepID=UPI0036068E9C
MATTTGAVQMTRQWAKRRANKKALERFGEFWRALQLVGDVLAEAEKLAKSAGDGAWTRRNTRHWSIATVDEVKSSIRVCRSTLRIVAASAKRFEPELIVREWRR